MTEAEWLACKEPDALMEFLRHQFSDRQWRLFICACCRRLLPLLTDEHQKAYALCEKTIVLGERFADGLAKKKDLAKGPELLDAWGMPTEPGRLALEATLHAKYQQLVGNERPMLFGRSLIGHPASETALYARTVAGWIAAERAANTGKTPTAAKRASTIQAKQYQVGLLRDLFGNPFRPIPPKEPDPVWTTQRQQWLAWNKGVIPKLAQSIYDERTFDRLPVLADALEEAGCTEADILNHCRQPGEHVRGCWVLDLLLEKRQILCLNGPASFSK